MKRHGESITREGIPDLTKKRLGRSALTLNNLGAAQEWAEARWMAIEGHSTVMSIKYLLAELEEDSGIAVATRKILAVTLLEPEGVAYGKLGEHLRISVTARHDSRTILLAHNRALTAGAIMRISSGRNGHNAEPLVAATREMVLAVLDAGPCNPVTQEATQLDSRFDHHALWERFDSAEQERLKWILDTQAVTTEL